MLSPSKRCIVQPWLSRLVARGGPSDGPDGRVLAQARSGLAHGYMSGQFHLGAGAPAQRIRRFPDNWNHLFASGEMEDDFEALGWHPEHFRGLAEDAARNGSEVHLEVAPARAAA